ncbi:glycoside hydrolase family 3 C-terminal domain-containing protein [Brachybacterium sp. J153]|uniref:glycoside hydrolase family 3 C-terminal domain-containing protein n=1 Tax=Brachybacterium sp. J153 TaxID=3116488 RepID=UPI002E787675|nr:glycoside hydrolase family 3 C-terminal domain-containing protein [Brachybacterium sp. J153]MEE1617753.1 glycoside hydrolase family 3 C-terminal domain-containing protein [Brachybacterium sp. J153]
MTTPDHATTAPTHPLLRGSDEVAALPAAEKIALTGGRDFWYTHGAPSLGLEAVMTSDGPHGLRTQKADADHLGLHDSVPATCFPPAVGLSASWSRETAAAVAAAIAEEAIAEGVSVVLGPGMNIKRSPLCGRNFEYFSEDPHLAGEMAVAYVNGMQDRGVGTSVKHFALNNQETDRIRVDVSVDERTLHEIYLRAFRAVVTRAQPWTIMCSYNSVLGTLVSQNPFLLSEVLREQWGFEGLVVSDWGAVVDRPAAVAAGLDLQMPADPGAEQALAAALEAGEIDPAHVDRAATKVVELLRRSAAVRSEGATYDVDAHHQVALEAARRAIVLLRNEDQLLPLDPETAAEGALAVIGDFAATPRYQGAGSSHVNAHRLSTALDAIRESAGDVPFARGFVPGGAASSTEDDVLRAEAVELARSAGTVVLFLGLGEDVESEGYDRTDMDLPAAQERLLEEVLAANPRTVVVLSNGSAIRLSETLRSAPAVLEAWLLGQAGGEATADVLFGRVAPSGKLAETIPLRLEDVPATPYFPGEHGRVTYGEGLFVGYRGLDARGTEVAFPFGHGLSYTTFEYADLAVSARDGGLVAELTVTNTGSREGREVVQAYVSVPGSSIARAPRELKGFADVTLAPGASARVTVEMPEAELQYWDVRAGQWAVEGGTYRVEIGASSRDLRLEAEAELAGTEPRIEASFSTTPLELAAIPGGAEALHDLAGHLPFFQDPEMAKMFEQIPVGRLTGFGGFSREQIQEFLDRVNAL